MTKAEIDSKVCASDAEGDDRAGDTIAMDN